MMTKKSVLIISGIGGGLFVLLLLSLLYDFCGPYRHVCKSVYTPIAYAFFSFPFVFLLSLLTYWAKDELFRAWWNFARWWVPVIVVVTLLLENAGGGGSLNMGQDFTIFILVILYTIFIITSIVKIIKRYSYLKFLEQGISGDKLNELKHKTNKKIAIAVILFLTAWFLIGYLM